LDLTHRGFVAVPLTVEPGLHAEVSPPAQLRAWLG
jgi:hypothetical protein